MRFKQKSLPKYNRFLLPEEEDSIGRIQITDVQEDEYSTVGAREAYNNINNDTGGGPIFINDQESPLTPKGKHVQKQSFMMMPSTQKKMMSKKIGGIIINNATEMLDQSSEEEEEDSINSPGDSCDFEVDEIEDK